MITPVSLPFLTVTIIVCSALADEDFERLAIQTLRLVSLASVVRQFGWKSLLLVKALLPAGHPIETHIKINNTYRINYELKGATLTLFFLP